MPNMTNRDENIINAAIQVFMRYGIRRTTMNDIASEAGLVRQTLYTAYSSKDEVLCAAIRYFADQSLSAIRKGWEGAENLGEKLDIYFEHAIIASFAIVRSSPDADDMISGYNAAGKAEIARAQERKKAAIAEILDPHESGIRDAGLSVDQLADYIQSASMGVRNSARTELHLRSLLAALKTTVLSATGSSERGPLADPNRQRAS